MIVQLVIVAPSLAGTLTSMEYSRQLCGSEAEAVSDSKTPMHLPLPLFREFLPGPGEITGGNYLSDGFARGRLIMLMVDDQLLWSHDQFQLFGVPNEGNQ